MRIPELMEALYEREIGSILVEGGSVVFREFLDAGVVDELSLFVAPRLIGAGVPAFAVSPQAHPAAFRFRTIQARRVGADLLIHALM